MCGMDAHVPIAGIMRSVAGWGGIGVESGVLPNELCPGQARLSVLASTLALHYLRRSILALHFRLSILFGPLFWLSRNGGPDKMDCPNGEQNGEPTWRA